MTRFVHGKLDLYNCDCMDLMAKYPDKHFELAIVDPPYGIDINNQSQGKGGGVARKIDYIKKDWDKSAPTADYWEELFRISNNQIIFGANHFISRIPFNSSCWIVWDKDNGECDFADCELAWTSFKSAVRRFKFRWAGMLQEDMKNKENRIHPTQKPVALYKWLLHNYAKAGDKILDSHLGSGSIAIACHQMGFELTGSELDADYFQAMTKRITEETKQQDLFAGDK